MLRKSLGVVCHIDDPRFPSIISDLARNRAIYCLWFGLCLKYVLNALYDIIVYPTIRYAYGNHIFQS